MDPEFLSKTEEQEWVQRRISEVGKCYSAYSALSEAGVEIPDENTSFQILCPFHGDKNKPSARYYAPSGRHLGHFFCFKCRDRLDGVGLYAKFKGKRFYDALSELERRYSIKVPKRPELSGINPSDRNSEYRSLAWSDVIRHLDIIETKLIRKKSMATMPEYTKVCRLLDRIRYDFTQSGKSSDEMVRALQNASNFIDDFSLDII